jgi:hypothetical protein
LYPVGTTTITWTATDADGNTATCGQSITVRDSEKPTISCPRTVTVPVDAGKCTVSRASLVPPTSDDNCGVASVTNDAPPTLPLGDTVVTWTVLDTSGNQESCTQTVTVKDAEKPAFVLCPPAGPTATATCLPGGVIGAVVNHPVLSATDNCSTPTIGYSQESGTAFPVGDTTVTATATDAAGNATTCLFMVSVRYDWSGVLQPINADGTSVFKAGSTLPVKFQLTGASACITNAVAALSYAKVYDNVPGGVNEADSTSAATTGNLFRYTGGQYLFNWSTKGLSPGIYQLQINLGDGVIRTVTIGLK